MIGSLLLTTAATAQDQIPWAPSIAQAQKTANDERKLVLLHFYNDHCEPCTRVEQNVFTQPQVAQAIARNYVPVKIHAGQQPKIAEQYRVDRWPTDIICTPAGLEIMRTTSPQKAEAYVGLVDQVALQTGVGAARHWQTSMAAVGTQVLDPRVAQVQTATNQVAADLQNYTQQAQQRAFDANQQFQQTAGQTQATAQQWTQRTADAAQQMNGLAQSAGRDLQTAWNSGSAAAPVAGNSAAAPISGGAYAQFAPVAAQSPAAAPASQPAPAGPTNAPPSLPTANPYLNQQAPQTQQPAQPPAAAAMGPTFVPSIPVQNTPAPTAPPAQVAGPMPGSPSPALTPNQGLVPASQAPPIALEGYCPVTLVEAEKWKKADARYGAIHRGRTYLFSSEIEQKKFLANPDRYSPALSGLDPVAFAQRNQQVEGKRGYGVKYNNQVYLFENEGSLQVFSKSPHTFANTAQQAMLQADSGSRFR
jgi:YHS domain-containing protein